jgi:hypothetical protein
VYAAVDCGILRRERQRSMGEDLRTTQRSRSESRDDYREEEPSIIGWMRMDKLLLSRARRLKTSNSEKIDLSELDIANPVLRTVDDHVLNMYPLMGKDEHLTDILDEEFTIFSSNWFIFSTTRRSTSTKTELKWPGSPAAYISEIPSPLPTTKKVSEYYPYKRQPTRRPLRVFSPRSKGNRNSNKAFTA